MPVYEENAVDDDLLSEGKRNILDYLQSRGHFDATVEVQKENSPGTIRVTYRIEPGPVHKLNCGRDYWQQELSKHCCPQVLHAGSARHPVSLQWTL